MRPCSAPHPMVQILPPQPTTALSISFQCAYACCIALEIPPISSPAPAGQVFPSLLLSLTAIAVHLFFSPLLPAPGGPSSSFLYCCCWATTLRRRSKIHMLAFGRSLSCWWCWRRGCASSSGQGSSPLTAPASVADGDAWYVVAAAPRCLSPKYRVHLADAVAEAASPRSSRTLPFSHLSHSLCHLSASLSSLTV